jgi:hypothetical protein
MVHVLMINNKEGSDIDREELCVDGDQLVVSF